MKAQCPPAPQSTTCLFVGEVNDTLARIVVGLTPGSCRALVTVPKPALNTPGCATIADPCSAYTAGPATLRNNVGCQFTEACSSSFGCNVVTTTNVPYQVQRYVVLFD